MKNAKVNLRRRIAASQGGMCHYCGARMEPAGKLNPRKLRPRSPTIDHKRPLSRHGTDDIDNLCVCCHACNDEKAERTAEEYFRLIGRRPREMSA